MMRECLRQTVPLALRFRLVRIDSNDSRRITAAFPWLVVQVEDVIQLSCYRLPTDGPL
jgi:hypothetical protein